MTGIFHIIALINANQTQRNVPEVGLKNQDLSSLEVPTMRTHHAPYNKEEASTSSPDPFHTAENPANIFLIHLEPRYLIIT